MKFLVAIDLSDATDAVIGRAGWLARRAGAELRLIHIAEPDPEFVGFGVGPQEVRDRRAAELKTLHSRVSALAERVCRDGVSATGIVLMGPTVEAILNDCQSHDCGLIVIGTHGHSALYDVLVGSVAAGVLREATCPVVVVPAGANDRSRNG